METSKELRILWRVYLLKCRDRSLYCGVSNDVDARVVRHNDGNGAKYTKARLPVELVAVSKGMTKSQAFRLEMYIKKLPAGDKVRALEEAQ